jgi:hypothetical protein
MLDSGQRHVTPELVERIRSFARARILEEKAEHAMRLLVLDRIANSVDLRPTND